MGVPLSVMRSKFPTPRCRRCRKLVESFNVHLDVLEQTYRFVISCHGEVSDFVLEHQSVMLPPNRGGLSEDFFEPLPEDPAQEAANEPGQPSG